MPQHLNMTHCHHLVSGSMQRLASLCVLGSKNKIQGPFSLVLYAHSSLICHSPPQKSLTQVTGL